MSARAAFERLLRLVAIAALLASVWLAWPRTGRDAAGGTWALPLDQRARSAALRRWTTGPAPNAVDALVRDLPGGVDRDWLAALAGTGTRVTWRVAGTAPLADAAMVVEPLPDPSGVVRVGVAAPAGAAVVVRDATGPIGAVARVSGVGAVFRGRTVGGMLDATVAGVVARVGPGDSLVLRPLLVAGPAGWETKFLVRALEEDGWAVDTRLTVAPRAVVGQGAAPVLDTARYAAVIVVDRPATLDAAALGRYARSGGGVILVGEAPSAFPDVAVGPLGPRLPGRRVIPASDPRGALAADPIAGLRRGATATDRRGEGGLVTGAVRRLGGGRVLQIGYEDSWRWRLAGGDSGMAAHRRWWASQVSGVAYAPALPRALSSDRDPAPLASWIARFGAPAAVPIAGTRRPPVQPFASWLFAVAIAAIAVEIASRRLRGAG